MQNFWIIWKHSHNSKVRRCLVMTQILPTLPIRFQTLTMTTNDGKFLTPGGQEIVKYRVG